MGQMYRKLSRPIVWSLIIRTVASAKRPKWPKTVIDLRLNELKSVHGCTYLLWLTNVVTDLCVVSVFYFDYNTQIVLKLGLSVSQVSHALTSIKHCLQ